VNRTMAVRGSVKTRVPVVAVTVSATCGKFWRSWSSELCSGAPFSTAARARYLSVDGAWVKAVVKAWRTALSAAARSAGCSPGSSDSGSSGGS